MAGAGGVYTGGGATVVMDPPPVVYVKVFHSGSEPDRHAKANATRVAVLAKAIAPRRSGRMANAIYADQSRDEKGRYTFGYKVVSPVYYSHYVHEGTGPSVRRVEGKNSMKFVGSRDGKVLHRKVVHHPGTPAQPFLQQALVAIVGG